MSMVRSKSFAAALAVSATLGLISKVSGVVAVAQTQTVAHYDSAQWAGLKYREVGPWRGGRVTAVTGVPSKPTTFYMGTVGGGV